VSGLIWENCGQSALVRRARLEKIVISTEEIAVTADPLQAPAKLLVELPTPVPVWGRLALAPLVLVLPLLCLIALILRVAMRNLAPRTRYGWLSYMTTLLTISGILTSMAAVVGLTTVPTPTEISQGLSDFDSVTEFPSLPSTSVMSAQQMSAELKPLVTVISPAARTWFGGKETPADSFGAGILFYADSTGYLIATARHIIDSGRGKSEQRALVAASSGVWSAATVVARHKQLDLLLIWLPRKEGSGYFQMPVDSGNDVRDGDSIYVIGHPQGLRYTLSTGIVSRHDKNVFQISAPVSPGNSGGPMFDDKGHLAGIVVYKMDRSLNPNSENLNFAVRAEALLDAGGWNFYADGRTHLDAFIQGHKAHS
jgi:S1-C subfamily serine protease